MNILVVLKNICVSIRLEDKHINNFYFSLMYFHKCLKLCSITFLYINGEISFPINKKLFMVFMDFFVLYWKIQYKTEIRLEDLH